jgi:hypothetical protein
MLRIPRYLSLLVFATVCLPVLAGCSGTNGGIVKGTLVFPPNVTPADQDAVTILFVTDTPDGPFSSATYSPSDKSFIARGPDGRGVPPGSYKITVWLDPYPSETEDPQRQAAFQRFNETYDKGNTKLAYEVTPDAQQSITIDLAKGTVTKN